MKVVGIHVNRFPLASETFVSEQARLLERYQPVFFVRRLTEQVSALPCYEIDRSPKPLCRKLFALAPGKWAWTNLPELSIVHAHFGPNGSYSMPIARSLRVPLVVTFHGFDTNIVPGALDFSSGISGLRYSLKFRSLCAEMSAAIAVSKFVASQLVQLGVPPGKIVQHYVGVDADKFFPLPEGESERRDLVCVARLVPSKGQRYLLKAFSRVATLVPHARLHIIGGGADRKFLEEMAVGLGLGSRVIFHGALRHNEVANLVRSCALSISPSIQNENGAVEAFGLASIEASASGVPSIVFDSGGLSETVLHGRTGLVVPERDVRGLSDAILMLLKDERLRSSMASAGVRHVREKFNLTKQTRLLEEIYNGAIERAS